MLGLRNKLRIGFWNCMTKAALFTIVQTRYQPKCSSTGNCLKKVEYINSVKYFSSSEK